LERWVWSGRNDTTTIENQIQQRAANAPVLLLWTGQSSDTAAPNDTPLDAYYIILDGTWQQAQAMYRKIETLWTLPRISLVNVQQSKYTLRKDYTGWREKFGSNEGGGDLLCTAEVMAAVLDRRNDTIAATEIRDRLDTFQRRYPQIAAKRKDQTP
jgi:DTW domain-containing protein YfiP